ncbi:MAG: DnaD domain protein [Streptococcaceae bacterium]|jgi:DNA replication protein|nr:DnaD domain protein [Streptococcaceae bacterium]
MDFLEEYKGQVVLPSALFLHFDALFDYVSDFTVWTFLLHDARLAPSDIAAKLELSADEVNLSLSRLEKAGLLAINFDKKAIFDVSPAFQKLSELTEPVSAPETTDNDEKNVIQSLTAAFEAEMGVISPLQMEEIRNWVEKDHYEPQLIQEALREAALNRKVSINYIRAILRNWRQDGVRTSADIVERRTEREVAASPEPVESFFIPTDGPWNAQ